MVSVFALIVPQLLIVRDVLPVSPLFIFVWIAPGPFGALMVPPESVSYTHLTLPTILLV